MQNRSWTLPFIMTELLMNLKKIQNFLKKNIPHTFIHNCSEISIRKKSPLLGLFLTYEVFLLSSFC